MSSTPPNASESLEPSPLQPGTAMSQSNASQQVESTFRKSRLNILCPPLSSNRHRSSGSQCPEKH
ncbi:hypothetical protein FRC19_000608, partial [Serendipita sp. 401]